MFLQTKYENAVKFIDDGIMFPCNKEDRYRDIEKMLTKLYHANMRISMEKSHLFRYEVEFQYPMLETEE